MSTCQTGWAAYARAIRRLRVPIVLLWLSAFAVAFAASPDVTYDPDVLVYFDESRPERAAFDAVEARFGRSYEVVTLVVPLAGSVLTGEGLEALARLERASRKVEGVEAVRSILSLAGLAPQDVLDADAAGRAAIAGELADLARRDPSTRAVLAADASVAALAAIVRDPGDAVANVDVAARHRAVRDAVAPHVPGVELIQTGRVVIDDAFFRESRDDVNTYAGLQMAILATIVFAALGSVSLTLALLVPVIGITGGSVGVIALAGVELNGISSAAPAVLMGLMVATALHIAIAWQNAVREGADKVEALARAYQFNARPVVLSVATTAVSFLILNTAESPPFRQLGNLVALGLAGVLLMSFTLLPALIALLPTSRAGFRAPPERALAALGAFIARRARWVAAATAILAALAAWGAANITINDTFSHYFDERYEVRRATDLFEKKLSGTTIVDVSVDTGAPGGALATDAREAAAALTSWLTGRAEVARVDTLATLGAGEPDALLAAVDALAANGGPRLLDAAARHLRFQIVMRGVSSRDTLAFAADVDREAERLYGAGRAEVTGMPVLSAQLSVGSARAMIIGMGLALATISALLVFTLRSVRLGLVSLVPNLLPVALAFGAWGLIVGEVSFAATVVGALTYGIVVDDTVHILAKYQRFAERLPTEEAIRAAFAAVGVPVVATTLALALSFLPFALSGFLVNRHFGALTALTLGAALLADLLLLPALLKLFGPARQTVSGSRSG